MTKRTCTLSFAVLLLISNGCSHYELGRPGNQGGQVFRLWITQVEMMEVIPQVSLELNRELREAAIRDTRFRLVSSESDADRILKVAILNQDRESLARRSEDTGLSDVLAVEIVASFEVFSSNGTVILDGVVDVEGQIFRTDGFSESFRQRNSGMLSQLSDDILQAAFSEW